MAKVQLSCGGKLIKIDFSFTKITDYALPLWRINQKNRFFTMPLVLREATEADAEALLSIFAPYVEQTAINFELEVPSLEEFARRIAAIRRNYPYLVATDGDDHHIVGYAYASRFKQQAAYNHAVETSIYVARNDRRHGTGRFLYTALEQRLRAQGILNLNACITFMPHPDDRLPAGSIPFHSALGFVQCAHFHKCGYKFGRWYDMIWMEKLLGLHPDAAR